ncbi:hypothetical protein IGI04_020265 [Brassica rapa subsp. trilocularis]|uniref:Uncharacterized protein n=1 Tax=Brassica rapa subsp. trilocularis TaxID=1813537 RepID=A0ABQ7MLJ2_BRACM|nr:hypothetical protein IGI04_020265 [Brassica rapa subsp. trilocularis]
MASREIGIWMTEIELSMEFHWCPFIPESSSEHLAVSVTLAWLNNGGNEDGGSCLAQWRGLEPFSANSVSQFSADSGHASLSFMEARDMKKGKHGVDNLTTLD